MGLKHGFKNGLLAMGLCVLSSLAVLIYWNQHLYYRAGKTDDLELKKERLEKAVRLHPYNDRVYYELGKVNFSLTVSSIQDIDTSSEYLEESLDSFTRSLRLNPAYAAGHYSLGRSLQYADFMGHERGLTAFDEFVKAARLAGYNQEIIHETAKIYLSRWNRLNEEEKNFAGGILKQAACSGERDSLLELLHGWALSVEDYAVIEAVLPEEEWALRLYAEFLGSKSLSCGKRQQAMAAAEHLRFQRAQEEYLQAERDWMRANDEEASKHYRACSGLIKSLKFYQNLIGRTMIKLGEYRKLKKEVSLKLGLCQLRRGDEWEKIGPCLREYLELEDSMAELDDLEQMLQGRGFLSGQEEGGFDDLERTAFQVRLNNRQNRFRDSMRLGGRIRESLVLIPKERIADYAAVMIEVGNAHQLADYLYDAVEYYRLALDADPRNLEAMLRLRDNYTRLDKSAELRKLNARIAECLSPEVIRFKKKLKRGRMERRDIFLDGEKTAIEIRIERGNEDPPPLISVMLNGMIVVEKYLEDDRLEIEVDPLAGRNRLDISVINRDVVLEEVRLRVK